MVGENIQNEGIVVYNFQFEKFFEYIYLFIGKVIIKNNYVDFFMSVNVFFDFFQFIFIYKGLFIGLVEFLNIMFLGFCISSKGQEFQFVQVFFYFFFGLQLMDYVY